MLLYYITDRTPFGDTEAARRRGLLNQIRLAAEAGLDFIQLREKDLPVRELEALATEAAEILRGSPTPRARFLVNSRIDIAIAAGADGVHLRADDLPASEARAIFAKAGISEMCIAASCHTIEEIAGMLGISTGTVKSRIFYARKQLAEKLRCYANTIKKR